MNGLLWLRHGQILTDCPAGGDFGNVGLSVENAGYDNACQDEDDRDDDNNLFGAHCCFLRTSADGRGCCWKSRYVSKRQYRDNTETSVLAFRILSRN